MTTELDAYFRTGSFNIHTKEADIIDFGEQENTSEDHDPKIKELVKKADIIRFFGTQSDDKKREWQNVSLKTSPVSDELATFLGHKGGFNIHADLSIVRPEEGIAEIEIQHHGRRVVFILDKPGETFSFKAMKLNKDKWTDTELKLPDEGYRDLLQILKTEEEIALSLA